MKLKRILATVSAAAMVVSSLSLSAFAEDTVVDMLGQHNFDDGVGLPWHTCETAPGDCDFDISGGTYNIKIVNPGGASRGGEDRWDIQFRHRGLKITAGHQYEVKYEMTASNSGNYYTKIGNLVGDVEAWHNMSTSAADFDQNWSVMPISANTKKSVDLKFTATKTIDVAEWAFHLGGSGPNTATDCFPAGTVIKFDNMYLSDLTDSTNVCPPTYATNDTNISVNQMGYYTNRSKQATVVTDSTTAKTFKIYNASGTAVYTGTTKPFGADKDSGKTVQIADFSDFKTAGKGYYIKVDGLTMLSNEGTHDQIVEAQSYPFDIAENVYGTSLLADSLNYFYQNRSAIAIESQYITSGDKTKLARAAGHTSDIAVIQTEWSNTANLSGATQDVTGGWYDAGDHGKYVVNGGIALWELQNEYEIALKNGDADTLFGDGKLSLPENSNQYPDLLDEARWEMKWMFTMIVKDGTYKGMVYHKVHDESWTALGVAPADDDKDRIIKPPTTTATLNLAACAAQASRLWAKYDSTFAADCLAKAKSCYAAAKANPAVYASLTQNIGGGPYGDDNATDEFYWAATELYITTGDASYLADMKASTHHLKVYTDLTGGEDTGTVGTMDWGNVSALGCMSLALNEDKLTTTDAATLNANITAAADTYLEMEDSQGYGLPLKQSLSADGKEGYPWGSNSFVVDNAIAIAYAYQVSQDTKYLDGATKAMDYIFGRNALDFAYVTGYGENALTYPHHRYWAYTTDNTMPKAPNGVMSGGPNSGMNDPWVQGMGVKPYGQAPQLCYTDNSEAWSVNECTINWNGPLAWLAGYMQVNGNKEGGSTPTVKYGDVHIDGVVDLSDVINLAKYVAEIDTLNTQQMANADVQKDGVVDMVDLIKLAKFNAELISESALGTTHD